MSVAYRKSLKGIDEVAFKLSAVDLPLLNQVLLTCPF